MNWGAIGTVIGVVALGFSAGAWVTSSEESNKKLSTRVTELGDKINKLESHVMKLNGMLSNDIDSLSALSERSDNLEKQLDNYKSLEFIPSGMVVAFAMEKCPNEQWLEYKEAYGRFVRGIDKSIKKVDPDGQRLPGNLQEDEFGMHTHSYVSAEIYGRSFKGENPGARPAVNKKGDVTSTGGVETRPKNVALLYCIKNKHNKRFKTDSQREAFLPCVDFSDLGGVLKHCIALLT
ncbi:hypothetical protein CGH63_24055, partial [Vibrio parahaemolyticus]